MVTAPDSCETFRFGDFVLDLAAYELRDKGRPVRLERQPMDVLILLVERRGHLVTRAEIVERLWGPDVFVEVEAGVHTAVRKIRRALRDSPDAPKFLDTVPGKGYRFVAPVRVEGPDAVAAAPASVQARPDVPAPEAVPSKSPTSNRVRLATLVLVLAVLAGLSAWAWHRTHSDATRQTRNADAYYFYLHGRNVANQRTNAAMPRAIDDFVHATALDPNYALAWAGLAKLYSGSMLNADEPPRKVGLLAMDAARRAVRIDPQLGEAQEALGHSLWTYGWDWPAAERAMRRAVALDPESTVGHMGLGHLLSQMGQHLEAGREMRRARDLDPLFAMSHALSSQVAYQARDYPSAIEYANEAITIDPDFWVGHIMLGQAYEGQGRTAEALGELLKAARFSGQNSKALSFRAYLLAKAGRADEARDVLRILEAASLKRYVPPYAFALVHAGLGDRDAVFKWLNEAFAAHDVHLIYLTVDPKWDPYRDDPRFKAQVDRCNFMRVAAPQNP
jgi:DNA-binding winged helix-turn-helix (wHTH) protein/tetratricopeptide (TPR) repeat protein